MKYWSSTLSTNDFKSEVLLMEVREADPSLASQDAMDASVMPQDFIHASHLTAYAA